MRRVNRAKRTSRWRADRKERLRIESLASRCLLAADVFLIHDVAISEAPRAMAVHLADLDGDSDLDAISGAGGTGELAWFENLNDSDSFGPKRPIVRTMPVGDGLASNLSITSADLDGDGDLDLIGSLNEAVSSTFWLENLDGRGSFGDMQAISSHFALSIVAADLDGDQDLDLFTGDGWHENLDGRGTFSEIRTYGAEQDGIAVAVADFDADGDLDVAVAQLVELVWYRNLDGKGTWSPSQFVTSGLGVLNAVAADFDGDGDQDLLSANVFHSTNWFENTDGNGTFVVRQVGERGASRLVATDVDVDGDLDVISDIGWFENQDGKGNFQTGQTVPNRFGIDFALGDIDGDGDPDLLSAEPDANRVQWFRNREGTKTFEADQILTNSAVPSPADAQTVDLDGDGDQDVVAASRSLAYNNVVAWYENLDGQGTFRVRQTLPVAVRTKQLFLLDLDGDGDCDLGVLEAYGALKWFENADGRGSFASSPRTILEFPWNVWFTDIDGDGDYDLLAATGRAAPIHLYENDSRGNFLFRREIPRPDVRELDYLLSTADIDGDGDQDLLVSSRANTLSITWQQNLDGRGSFGVALPIPTNGMAASQWTVTDFDRDGDQDLLFADTTRREVFWNENTDGRGTFAAATPLSESGRQVTSLLLADVDQDGDGDLIVGERYLNSISWYEQLDAGGTLGPRRTVATDVQLVESIFAADLNGDGRADLVSAASGNSHIAWHERRIVGDVNKDGLFDSTDLVAIFQAGEYEDAASDNSTFDEGDWNGDGEFNSADLVLAFQLGHYSTGNPRGLRSPILSMASP